MYSVPHLVVRNKNKCDMLPFIAYFNWKLHSGQNASSYSSIYHVHDPSLGTMPGHPIKLDGPENSKTIHYIMYL